MNWRLLLVLFGFVLAVGPVNAQTAWPRGAPHALVDSMPPAPADPTPPAPVPAAAPPASTDAPVATPKPKMRAARAKAARAAESKPLNAPGVKTIDRRPLMLNGKAGLLQVSGSGKTLEVDKLQLPGESVSDPSQRCIVDIVGEKPIEATSEGRPDGLDRYDVDVPACPFTFDVVDGAILVPSQITACVFKAADCQTGPGGLWGPDGAQLGKDVAAIGKRRREAEKAMAKAVRDIDERAKDDPDAANLLHDQSAFASERTDACRDYLDESAHGFCAASLTEARAALLDARIAALAAAQGMNSEKPEKKKEPKPTAASQ